jgi:putative colanic acid biosynthesis acetyltransferase WcaF
MNKNYSTKEKLLRIVWRVVEPVFFSYSPRLFYSWRNLVLRIMGARLGTNVKIYPSARIMYPWLLEIKDNTTISWGVIIYNLGLIKIGSGTMISQYAHLCGGTHDYTSGEFELLRSGLKVGNNVWIAADSFIGPGVTVHDGSIVAARAVVTKDVETGTIVGGNPSKEIRKLKAAYNNRSSK